MGGPDRGEGREGRGERERERERESLVILCHIITNQSMKEKKTSYDYLPADIFLRDICVSQCTPLSDTESTTPLPSTAGSSSRDILPPSVSIH